MEEDVVNFAFQIIFLPRCRALRAVWAAWLGRRRSMSCFWGWMGHVRLAQLPTAGRSWL